MKRILFVDDEPNVLESMRDALRPHRRRWTLVFAASGREALTRLAAGPFDAVVSDMRMPGMDGASLLAEIEERHPHTVRVVLSGYTEMHVAARAASVAHLFLAKPCSTQRLMATVERACGVRDLLAGRALLDVIAAMPPLPTVPPAYARLTLALRDPAGPPQDAAVIARDLLGSTVRAFEPLDPVGAFRIAPLQEHSLLVARIATRIADDAGLREDVLGASLLHDLGKLAYAAGSPEAFADSLAIAAEEAAPLYLVERRQHHVTHAEIGAYLLARWGLPHGLVEAVAYHHRPAHVLSTELTAATIVHVADAVAHAVGPPADAPGPDVDEAHLASLGLADRLPAWVALGTAEATAPRPQLSSPFRSGGR